MINLHETEGQSMTDYTELVKALRERARRENEWYEHGGDIIEAAAAAIEALQAEIRESIQKCAECGENEPKRGEWKPFDLTYGRSIYSCSVCEQATEVPMCMEKPMYAYCPNCGAKMEVQE